MIASQDDSISPIERMNMLKETMDGFCKEDMGGSEKEQRLSDEPLYRTVLELTNTFLQQQQKQQS